jgi:hypothetical protein
MMESDSLLSSAAENLEDRQRQGVAKLKPQRCQEQSSIRILVGRFKP